MATDTKQALENEITQRLSQVEPHAPNYFGRVPTDYADVVANLPSPEAAAVAAYLAEDRYGDMDGAIAAAYHDLLPAGYDGVAIEVRSI